MTTLTYDAVIIGGGIAGLWTLNRLCNRGYNAILLENNALGSCQTVASQGMIHGGIKYTLSGTLTGASEAIADMPDHWRACLHGEGDVDLRGATVLSDHFYLWSTSSLSSRFGGFIASKATRGRVEKVAKSALPPLFANDQFRGKLYRLVDMVMDTPSVINALVNNYRQRIFKIDWAACHWQNSATGEHSLSITTPETATKIDAKAFIFSAGKGNQQLLDAVGAPAPKMQLRPLQQVMMKHQFGHSFFGHCVTTDKTPRLTISSHPLEDGSQVWYLGGSLAEKGVEQTAEQLIATTRNELEKLMPWLDFSTAQWATLHIDRAEPRQHKLVRPDKAFAEWAANTKNIIAAWPTKLTLSPHMATEVERLMQDKSITPAVDHVFEAPRLPFPGIARTPWQEVFTHVT